MTSKRILIVDDEIGYTRLLKANLELTDLYEVRVENQPENAVQVARQFQPHLILLDVVMPHMSGTNLAEVLRADPELKSVPIVFLTAAAPSLLQQDATPIIGRFPHLPKPACMEDILHLLEEHLSPPTVPGLTNPATLAQTPGGNNE